MNTARYLPLVVSTTLASPLAFAQHQDLEEIVVTASALRVGATDLVQAAVVLAGDDLSRRVARGARVLRPLRHLQPGTGLVSLGLFDATDVADLADAELFGPLLIVRRVGSFAAAIDEANRTAFGLAAGLIGGDAKRYATFSRGVRAGIINWNTPLTGASGGAPFGGLGLSGNFRPSGFFAADYCSYAVASMEASTLNPAAPVPPGLRPA